ncbi:MAG: HpcH/HpaI aldolase/citrate lyase family protein [Candidatus Coatesbacteria bacterium]|nr:HpcH/HpaI aldolase/citrate lyase family protein [Candidatus Coatesbacteria bacterium]
MLGEAGSRSASVRSDCYILFNSEGNGREIKLISKVQIMYGRSIIALVNEVLDFYNIADCTVQIEDQGALPFVIAARMECAIKRALPDTENEFLLPLHKSCCYLSNRDRFRRSRLYLPGNQPKFFVNAGLHCPDGIILDLEDSVAPSEKDAARILVRNALREIDFKGAERMVRINQGSMGLVDLEAVIPHNVHLVLIPKAEKAEEVQLVDETIRQMVQDREVFLMPIIESCLGVENAYEIAKSATSIVAIAIGLEDYTADLGTPRSEDGLESFTSRSRIVNAAKAAGVQAIDTVYSDVGNMKGLYEDVKLAKKLGFEGKGCIHPRQIPVVHQGFEPDAREIEKACKIVRAFQIASDQGLGVVSLGTKMIDPPVVKRAIKIVEIARKMNLIDENWMEGGAL